MPAASSRLHAPARCGLAGAEPAVAGRDHPAAPVREQPCLLRPLLLGRSVDAVPLYLNHGEVSLHLVQSGKTHESRAMNARPRLASAAPAGPSDRSRGSPTTARRSPVSAAAWASTAGHGRRFTPRARRGRWRLQRRPVAAPLAVRQHGVGVRLLLEHEPPVPPALGAPAHPEGRASVVI